MAAMLVGALACGDADEREEPPEKRVLRVSANGDTAWELTTHDTLWFQARDDARCTLYEFLRRVREKPKSQTMASVKATFRAGHEAEQMWMHVRAIEGDSLRGVLAHQSFSNPRLHEGDTVAVALRDVVDWYTVDRDTLIGGFGLRLQRSRLLPRDRAAYDSTHYYVVDPDSVARHRFGWRCADAPN